MAAIRMKKTMIGAPTNKYIITKIGSTMTMSEATSIAAPIAGKTGDQQSKSSR